MTDKDNNIKGFRTVYNKEGFIIGYKKADSKAYTVIYKDFNSEAISKLEEVSNKPTFKNILYKLYRGDLLKKTNGEVYKIYQLPKGQIALHPVNEVRIQSRDLKNYPNGKVNTKKPSINIVFNKEKMYKIKVNILGHII